MDFATADISQDSLYLVSNAVSYLNKFGGRIDDNALWAFADRSLESTKLPQELSNLGLALQDAFTVVRRLKDVRDSLDKLARSCERKLESVKSRIQPAVLHHGILTLPDALLSQIFHEAAKQADHINDCGPEAEVILSQVCRRFRSLALSLPTLWSYIDRGTPWYWIPERLVRSKESPLAVAMWADEWNVDLKQFLASVFPHARRWRSLFLSIEDNHLERPDIFVSHLSKTFDQLHLPNLETLDIELESCFCDNEYVDIDSAFNFFGTWNMPKLRRICVEDVPLRSIINAFPSAAIESLSITWLQSEVCRIREALHSMSGLVELSLSGSNFDWNSSSPHITLPRVKKFELSPANTRALVSIATSFHMPTLEVMGLTYSSKRFEKWVSSFPSLPSLKVLDLTFVGHAGDSLDLSILFRKFEGLEQLFMHAPNCAFELRRPVDKMPPLRSCRISVGKSQCVCRLDELIEALRESGRWDNFEYFEFDSSESWCSNAGDIIPKEKLRWIGH